jgi:hypothetical protein
MEYWLLSSSPFSVWIWNWWVLWENSSQVPPEEIWIIQQSSSVELMVMEDGWSLISKVSCSLSSFGLLQHFFWSLSIGGSFNLTVGSILFRSSQGDILSIGVTSRELVMRFQKLGRYFFWISFPNSWWHRLRSFSSNLSFDQKVKISLMQTQSNL